MDELGWTSEDDAWDARGAMGIAEWSAMQNAARVLREAEAKRTILARHCFNASQAEPGCAECQPSLLEMDDGVEVVPWPCIEVLTQLRVWRDHADYDPEWAS
jgi:hypothetical protein